ncbi:MAG: hypothetical protein WA182_19540 [Candidatus Sulfotelmatobacter sp.]
METVLDRLKATVLKNGKRVFVQTADQCVAYHNVANADAIKILHEYGIVVNIAENDTLPENTAPENTPLN